MSPSGPDQSLQMSPEDAVTVEDIRKLVYPVLRHRIVTNFNADAEGVGVDQVIERILQVVPEPSCKKE